MIAYQMSMDRYLAISIVKYCVVSKKKCKKNFLHRMLILVKSLEVDSMQRFSGIHTCSVAE